MDDNTFGVPAGWYPDPLGLPQLRWWDSQSWTEHTSEARAPIIVQPVSANLGFADEEPVTSRASYSDSYSDSFNEIYVDNFSGEAEQPLRYVDEGLPSRREQRERERREAAPFYEPEYTDFADFPTENAPDREELSAQPLLAMTLKELEPPLTDAVTDATPGPKRAATHTNAMPAASTLSELAEEQAPERTAKQLKTYTAAVWAIALMPAIQLAVSILLIFSGLGENYPLFMLVLFGPYLIVLFFAAFDRLLLQIWGHKNPASAWWALLFEPGYLIARTIRTYRETGKGFAPLGIFTAAMVSVLAGLVILPGLVIAALPSTFASEAASSVEADAFGLMTAKIDVTCPTPPVVIGDTFTCIRESTDGTTDSVAVQLARRNGWIAWDVIDWGTAVMN